MARHVFDPLLFQNNVFQVGPYGPPGTAFQPNAFQTLTLAFQIDQTSIDNFLGFWKPFKRERRQIFKGRAPLSLKMR